MVRFLCRTVARNAPGVIGSPWTFLGSLVLLLVWLAIGPFFGFTGNWLLWPATMTSILGVVLMLLLQYSQNRDTRAIQLKLDELIRGLDRARTELVRLEELSDAELSEIEEEFEKLRNQDEAA